MGVSSGVHAWTSSQQLTERVYAMDVSYPLAVVATADRNLHIYNLTQPQVWGDGEVWTDVGTRMYGRGACLGVCARGTRAVCTQACVWTVIACGQMCACVGGKRVAAKPPPRPIPLMPFESIQPAALLFISFLSFNLGVLRSPRRCSRCSRRFPPWSSLNVLCFLRPPPPFPARRPLLVQPERPVLPPPPSSLPRKAPPPGPA
eukprot:365285-Chlamydomonas_euryale.AAC.1